jgi:hypothetical protein
MASDPFLQSVDLAFVYPFAYLLSGALSSVSPVSVFDTSVLLWSEQSRKFNHFSLEATIRLLGWHAVLFDHLQFWLSHLLVHEFLILSRLGLPLPAILGSYYGNQSFGSIASFRISDLGQTVNPKKNCNAC